MISALEIKVNKQKKSICHSVPKAFDFSQNSDPFHQVTFDHSISVALLIDKPNESWQNSKKFAKHAISTTKEKLFKRKGNSVTTANTNALISQTSEHLKLKIQTYQMRKKELKNESWKTSRGNIKNIFAS